MDAYRVSNLVNHFGSAVLDGPLRDRGVKEPDMVSIPRSLLHRLEMDVRVLTLVSSFLDCSGYSANSLLDEARGDPEASESTRQLMEALSASRSLQARRQGTCLVERLRWIAT